MTACFVLSVLAIPPLSMSKIIFPVRSLSKNYLYMLAVIPDSISNPGIAIVIPGLPSALE